MSDSKNMNIEFERGDYAQVVLENLCARYGYVPVIVYQALKPNFNTGAASLCDEGLFPANVQDHSLAGRNDYPICPHYDYLRYVSEKIGLPGEIVDVHPAFCTTGKCLFMSVSRYNRYCEFLLKLVEKIIVWSEQYVQDSLAIRDDIGVLCDIVDHKAFIDPEKRQRAMLVYDFLYATRDNQVDDEELEAIRIALHSLVYGFETKGMSIIKLHEDARRVMKGEKHFFTGCPQKPFLLVDEKPLPI